MPSLDSVVKPIHDFFNHPGLRRFWVRFRAVAALGAIFLLLPWASPEWFWPALAVSLVGEFIQLWCFASLKKTKKLACQGPYTVVRNPMYLGRYLILLGVLLLLGRVALWVILPYTVLYWFYMVNRVKREEVKLAEFLGADYLAYCERVNRFLPSFNGVDTRAIWFWDWELFRGNHGWMNLVGLLAVFALFYLYLFGL